MAVRSYNYKSPIVDKIQVKPAKVSVEYVTIRSCYSVKYVYNSPFTGKRYVFDRAGSTNKVTREEATDLLSKSRKGCGCGAVPQNNKIFEEAT